MEIESLPGAHSGDPRTSYEALEDANTSGRRAGHAAAVLAVVQEQPGLTSREIGEVGLPGIDRYEAARRLSDLAGLGRVWQGPARMCTVANRRCVTWWPSPIDGQGRFL